MKLAQLIEDNLDEIIALESLDNGKPLAMAESDCKEVVNNIRYYAGWADKVTGKTYSDGSANQHFYTRREPYGIVGLISPWNFPLLMCEWKFGPAIAAGNCIVHKPSEVTPLTMIYVSGLFAKAGFPPGVYNCVTGYGPEAGEAITMSNEIHKVSFTGSSLVGRKMLDASAKSNIKKVHLELGGKTPVIICPDADLDVAANTAWGAIMYNMGQCCIAGSRLFIHKDVYDKVLEKMVAIFKTAKVGNAFDEGVNFGPLVNKLQFDKVTGFMSEAKKAGYKCLVGGERVGNKGYFVQPTIYTGIPDKAHMACEEIFGPVLSVMEPWTDINEAIKRANDTRYGLAAVAITRNMAWCEKMERELMAGTIFVNTYMLPQAFIPFGGYKESGFGRDNAEDGLLEYT